MTKLCVEHLGFTFFGPPCIRTKLKIANHSRYMVTQSCKNWSTITQSVWVVNWWQIKTHVTYIFILLDEDDHIFCLHSYFNFCWWHDNCDDGLNNLSMSMEECIVLKCIFFAFYNKYSLNLYNLLLLSDYWILIVTRKFS